MSQLVARSGPLGLAPEAWRLDVSFEEWRAAGRRLATLDRAIPWLIGDWVNFGEFAYGEKYAEAIEITGLEAGTLMNYAYVASRFDVSRRRETVSWSHHREVAALEPAEADGLLDQAAAGSWSKKRLRDEVRGRRAIAEPRAKSGGSQAPALPNLAKLGDPPRATLTLELVGPVASAAQRRRQLAERVEMLRQRAEDLGLRIVAKA